MVLFSKLETTKEKYTSTKPYPYYCQDSFLESTFAKELQQEILQIDDSKWDRYENCFEKKYTLRDKYDFPPLLKKLFDEFTSKSFVNELSEISGYKLLLDETRNFWGVHKYKNGDKLDIHVDAGLHPTLGLKKQLTVGLYLSYNFSKENGCALEIWEGENVKTPDCKLIKKIDEVIPYYNRFVMFTCNDYSWHGNPEPVCAPSESKRIFITLSYLSDNFNYDNKRVKAFFIKVTFIEIFKNF